MASPPTHTAARAPKIFSPFGGFLSCSYRSRLTSIGRPRLAIRWRRGKSVPYFFLAPVFEQECSETSRNQKKFLPICKHFRGGQQQFSLFLLFGSLPFRTELIVRGARGKVINAFMKNSNGQSNFHRQTRRLSKTGHYPKPEKTALQKKFGRCFFAHSPQVFLVALWTNGFFSKSRYVPQNTVYLRNPIGGKKISREDVPTLPSLSCCGLFPLDKRKTREILFTIPL